MLAVWRHIELPYLPSAWRLPCQMRRRNPKATRGPEAVNTLIGKRDVGGLRELISRDAKLEYNAERGIIQVLGCSQEVMAQLAVPTVVQLTTNGL